MTDDSTNELPTELAHQEAWSAVETEYEEVEGEWVQNSGGRMQHS